MADHKTGALLGALALLLHACAEDARPDPSAAASVSDVIVQDRFDVTTSPHGHRETLARLLEALDRRDLTVFAVIDHAAAASSVGAALPPSTLVIFGDPRAGTPLMRDVPLMGMELPLRALVYEADGEARLAVTGAANLARTYPLDGQAAILDRVAELTDGIAAEVTAE